MSMGDMMKMLQQAQELQGQAKQVQEQLARETVTGTAGGGMVTVEADGTGQLRRVSIDPSVASDVEMLEDLVLVAVTDAQKRAAALAQGEMGRLLGGLNLPFKLPL